MAHSYLIQLTERDPESGATLAGRQAEMEFKSHDDILDIISRIQAKGIFDENEAKVFALGLKMFSSVLLTHRSEEPFADLVPHFGSFMKAMKS